MKPIIIKEENGRIVLTVDQLQKIIDDSYQQGKNDEAQKIALPYYYYGYPYRYEVYPTWIGDGITCTTGTNENCFL